MNLEHKAIDKTEIFAYAKNEFKIIKTLSEESKLLEDNREGISPTESIPD